MRSVFDEAQQGPRRWHSFGLRRFRLGFRRNGEAYLPQGAPWKSTGIKCVKGKFAPEVFVEKLGTIVAVPTRFEANREQFDEAPVVQHRRRYTGFVELPPFEVKEHVQAELETGLDELPRSDAIGVEANPWRVSPGFRRQCGRRAKGVEPEWDGCFASGVVFGGEHWRAASQRGGFLREPEGVGEEQEVVDREVGLAGEAFFEFTTIKLGTFGQLGRGKATLLDGCAQDREQGFGGACRHARRVTRNASAWLQSTGPITVGYAATRVS